MKKISNEKTKKRRKNKRKIIIISILILLLITIIFGIIKLNQTLAAVENITANTIDIQFSTKEIVCDDVEITVSTTTKYDIYYYIDLKNEETAEENSTVFETNSNKNTTINNLADSNKNNINSIDNINNITNTTNSTNNDSSTPKSNNTTKFANNLYKKYENKIIVKNNATIYLKYAKKKKFCESAYSFEVNNIDKQGPKIGEIKTSSTNSSITLTINATDNSNPNFTYYFRLAEQSDFICTDDLNQYTFTDLEEGKTYTIYIKVADGFGNESEAATDCKVSIQKVAIEKQKYYIKVNLAANTVTIYSKDKNNEYTKPIKAMVCSVGKATPTSGKYNITYKYRWLALFGNVYGQYSTRIVGSILFHSVPYYSTEPNTLKYAEYDKLGTKASAGCIRLTVEDAKWIYDNVASGSTVEFYSDTNNPGPLGKPTAQKISDNEYRDWDPTDPDPRNPWIGGSGEVISTRPKDDENNNNSNTNSVDNKVSNSINNEISNSINNSVNVSVNDSVNNSVNNSNSIYTGNEIPWGTED